MNEERIEAVEKEKKKGFFARMSTPKKVIFIIVAILVIVAAGVGIAFLVVTNTGKNSIYKGYESNNRMVAAKTVQYNGKEYKYRDGLINILAMGIDKNMTLSEMKANRTELDDKLKLGGGRADALILITIDPDNKKISAMPINRYTMTNVYTYDEINGEYFPLEEQIDMQHEYSTGMADGCDLQVRAVSEMLHDIPINGYVSINLPAIRVLNNLVGGVEVEVLEDIPPVAHQNYDYGIGNSLTGVIGQKILLNDNQAYAYVRYRNMSLVGNSNEKRMARQKQYIKGLVKKIVSSTKKDLTFPIKMMEGLSDYMITDIDTPELLFIGTSFMGYSVDLDNMLQLPGELEWESDIYMGYRLDEEALQELIIKNYYSPVD